MRKGEKIWEALSPLHGQGNFWPCSPPMQTGQNMVICKPKYLTLNKKIGVLPHTKKLSPFSLQGWRALSKFKVHIETGGQTIRISNGMAVSMINGKYFILFLSTVFIVYSLFHESLVREKHN